MQIYFDWVVFAYCFGSMFFAVFICMYPVKDGLAIPFSKAMGLGIGVVIFHSTVVAMVQANIFNNTIPLFLTLYFFVYRKVLPIELTKILFLFFIVASYFCFSMGLATSFELSDMVYIVGEKEFNWTMNLQTLFLLLGVELVGAIPATLIIKRKVWPVIRDLQAAEWSSLWIIPLMFSVTSTLILEAISSVSWLFLLSMLTLAVSAFVCYLLIMRVMQKTADSARLQEQSRMMRIQLMQQREQYEALSVGIDQARKARHDLRHSLVALQGYAVLNDVEGMKDCLGQMIVGLPQDAESLYCKNYAINAVVRHYLTQAREKGVSITARLDIPENLERERELDLCVLIGNMLENAYEACCRTPGDGRISSLASMEGEYLTVTISNTFDGKLHMREDTYLSSKRMGEGIGINSIRAIAEKYQGYASFSSEAKVFEASAVIRL